jgi:hypothetical protein
MAEYKRKDEYPEQKSSDYVYAKDLLKSLEEEVYRNLPEPLVEEEGEPKIEKELELLKTKERVMQQMIKVLNDDAEPLKTFSAEVVGDIFDRVESLRQRILEIRAALDERRSINRKIVADIQEEIGEMEGMIAGVADIDKKREFKMHVTLLQMERRRENTNFWRDIIQLTKELQELEEQYRMELKISKLFDELKGR